jgi:hypothetical protein
MKMNFDHIVAEIEWSESPDAQIADAVVWRFHALMSMWFAGHVVPVTQVS